MNKKTIGIIIIIVVIISVLLAVFLLNKKTNKTTNIISSNNKILVVYYSAQNHTKSVAEQISKKLNADIFQIEPKEEYTNEDLDWTNSNSRVSKEHEDESLRNVELKTTEVPNWDQYDTIILGYPIWWGIAAWPTDTFVKAQDFNGKTIIPFCTSYSSGLGQSANRLKEEANGGNWLEGHRFNQDTSSSDINNWTNSLSIGN